MSLEVKDKTRVRLVFLGAAGVGKTALIRRFLQDTFEAKHRRTVEELHRREYEAGGGATVTVEVLDTSGSYSFPAMRRLSIQGGDAFALVYAVDDAASLEAVRSLRQEILEVRGDEAAAAAAIVVVGNKTDREAERAVSHKETVATVELDWNHSHVAASAKQNANVAEVFRELLRRAHPPSRLSPALRRRRETIPKDSSFRPPMNKTHSCVVS